MCSSQISKDLSASCKQFLSLAFSLQMKFFSYITNDTKEFLQTSYLPHPQYRPEASEFTVSQGACFIFLSLTNG